jgi:hypothetical protein
VWLVLAGPMHGVWLIQLGGGPMHGVWPTQLGGGSMLAGPCMECG